MTKPAKSKTARSPQPPANTPTRRHRPLASAIALALSLSIASAQAATIIVDSDLDTIDANTDICRLRDAIIAANTDAAVEGCAAGSGADSIRLFSTVGNTITLNSRLPTVTTDITIQGDGVSVNGSGTVGLMAASGVSANLSIDHLSMINGSAVAGGALLIDDSAKVMLSNSTLSGNTASTNGGAIHVTESELSLLNSTLSGNTATTNGGGIYSYEPYSLNVLSTLSLTNSTLSGNTAGVYGGGISVNAGSVPFGEGSEVNLVNSTLTGNQAGGYGGGLHGINGMVHSLNNSVIANSINPDGSAADYDCYTDSQGTRYGVNLVETGAGYCRILGTYGSVITDTDPALGTLTDNGGPTQTHAPLNSDSPLVNPPLVNPLFPSCQLKQEGINFFPDSVLFSASDQRGFQRTDGTCDIGAVEFNGAPRQTGPDFIVNSDQDPFIDLDPTDTVVSAETAITSSDGFCNESPGDCTLRDAVSAANEFSDLSTISFNENVISAGTVQLSKQLPTVVSNITIQGAGMVIDGTKEVPYGNFLSRIFEIDSSNLIINGLSLVRGDADSGGAILVRDGSTLALNNSTLDGNRAPYSGGGLSAVTGAQVTLTNSTISNNRARDIGGGIYAGSNASVTINHSTLFGNSAGFPFVLSCSPGLTPCGGGGIFLMSATVALNNSTLDQNETLFDGGGIKSLGGVLSINNSTLSENQGNVLHSEQTNFTIRNSTLSGNSFSDLTGGYLTAISGSEGQITNSTFVNNLGPGSVGGLYAKDSTITLTNSILTNSSDVDCSSPDGSITTSGVNLIKDGGSDCGLTSGPNLLTGDPMLGPLANNGGPTLTHFPLTGSPVIDAGDNAFVPEGLLYDQRGIGFPRLLDIKVDIGSVEWNPVIFADGFEGSDL